MHTTPQVPRKLVAATTALAMLLGGCATASSGISAAYVSPLQYQNYDCGQIVAEMQRIQVRVNQLAGRLDQAASNDKAIMGVGLILFWPALFALGGTKEQEAEYARLKGEYDALEKSANEKRCALPGAQQAATPAPASAQAVAVPVAGSPPAAPSDATPKAAN